MNWLDIVILLPMVYGLGRGLLRGFVREFTSVIAILGGVMAGKFLAPKFAGLLLSVLNMPDRAALALAYVLLFMGVALLCKLLARGITRFLRKVDLNWFNRLVGAVFGGALGALIMSLLLNLIVFIEPYYPLIKQEAKSESRLFQPTLDLASIAKSQLVKYLPEMASSNAALETTSEDSSDLQTE